MQNEDKWSYFVSWLCILQSCDIYAFVSLPWPKVGELRFNLAEKSTASALVGVRDCSRTSKSTENKDK